MVTEAEESMPSIDWVGPKSFLRVPVARMTAILRLRGTPHIGQMERPEGPDPLPAGSRCLGLCGTGDLQEFLALPARLEAEHPTAALPDQRRAGEQRVVLLHGAARRLVEVGVQPPADERARVPVDVR